MNGGLREAIMEEKQLICGHCPVGGGGSDQFCTFLGDFCMCVEITNILYLVLKHLTLVPRYHAYLRSCD